MQIRANRLDDCARKFMAPLVIHRTRERSEDEGLNYRSDHFRAHTAERMSRIWTRLIAVSRAVAAASASQNRFLSFVLRVLIVPFLITIFAVIVGGPREQRRAPQR